jgi:ABC-2 type transport system ATP-binding protein
MPGSAEPIPPGAPGGPCAEIIRVENLSRAFGAVAAVKPLSFGIPAGGIVGLVGSDGAGKTTLLRMIATMIPPETGRISVGGFDAVRERVRVKSLLGYMPQRFGLYQDLTVDENLDFFMDVYGITGPERKVRRERYLGFSNLLPFTGRRAGDLSGGMKQKLGLACVLVHEPRVLILDEPTNGVDPVSRQEFWKILAEMRRAGMTILVSTAYLDEGERCDRLLVMHKGVILADAAPGEFRGAHRSLEDAMVACIQAADAALGEERFGS